MDPVLGAILGTIVGGAISYLTAWRVSSLQHRQSERALVLEKVEALYEATLSNRESFRLAWAALAAGLASGDLGEHLGRVPKLTTDHAHMLVRLYVPSLRDTFDNLEGKVEAFRDTVGRSVFEAADKAKPERDAAQRLLLAAYENLNQQFDTVLEDVASVATSYVHE